MEILSLIAKYPGFPQLYFPLKSGITSSKERWARGGQNLSGKSKKK